MDHHKPVIAITHGDLNGISYEIILKTFAEPRVFDELTPVIYGSSKAVHFYRKHLDIQGINLHFINSIHEMNPRKVNFINCTDEDLKVEMGVATPEAGKAALDALRLATQHLQSGEVDALVTAPFNKKNTQTTDFNFPGHTEYLESTFGTGKSGLMLMINEIMRVAVVTGHIPVAEISQKLNTEIILEKLITFNNALKVDFNIIRPRIAVLGLNPHAGEEGLLGPEEQSIILPAIQQANELGLICTGPYAADGFFGSGYFNKFDGILAMYHDQGLIPFKTVSMESGVNYTAGLSIIRTSPAHGTAYDITGQNKASEESFRQALFMAYDTYRTRKLNAELLSNPLKIEKKRGSKIV